MLDCTTPELPLDWTIYQAKHLHQRCSAALRENSALDLDLSGVRDIDTAGLQLLLFLKREASRQAKPLRLTTSPEITAMFELFAVTTLFDAASDAR